MKNVRRAKAAQRWEAIAAGTIDDETRAWLVGIAKQLVAANRLADTSDLRLAVTRAVGFSGHRGPTIAKALQSMAEHLGADVLTDAGKRAELEMYAGIFHRNQYPTRSPASIGAIRAHIRRAVGKLPR